MIRFLSDQAGRLLPEGRQLPDAVWQRRHDGIIRTCLAAAGALLLCWWWHRGRLTAVLVLAGVTAPLAAAAVARFSRPVRPAQGYPFARPQPADRCTTHQLPAPALRG